MNLKMKAFLIGAVAYAFSLNAMALACSSTSNWGTMGPPAVQVFGQSFTSAGSYADCYSFSLDEAADSLGWLIEIDPLSKLDIDVTSVSLFSGGVLGDNTTGSLLGSFSDTSFAFSGLGTGTYSLAISSAVTRDFFGLPLPVGYAGAITTVSSKQVPEPATLGLFGLALTGLGLVRRRRTAR